MSQTTPSGSSSVAQTQSRISHGHFIPVWSRLASLVPDQMRPIGPQILHGKMAPDKKRHNAAGGFYVTEFDGSSAYGYANKNTSNNPPSCSVGPVSYVNGQAVDGKGNFIDPDGGTRSVIIFGGPGQCGSEVGSFSDSYGQPSDASSPDAVHGNIAVGNIFDTSGAGSISVCTLSGGCTANLTNPNMYEVAGVAMDNSGNCWASATNSGGTATLTYFAGCTGSGVAATGYMNSYYGGLDIDASGNLVSISAFNSEIYVYSGCNPACTLVGGPFPMQGEAVFGHLNKQSMTFATGDFEFGQVDVYYYSPTSITYWYSFNNGLTSSYIVEGVSYNPRSKQ
ncbi:MAG: hypothetical protein JO104_11110 [Candidatus Eremiobacteraeota bacterium]|nr:hypothetical protein [Candidatus Eremiobacteraeota bacterium]